MKQCPHCGRLHHNPDTTVCDQCWIALMRQDRLEGWEDDDDWEERHPIDHLFDRTEER